MREFTNVSKLGASKENELGNILGEFRSPKNRRESAAHPDYCNHTAEVMSTFAHSGSFSTLCLLRLRSL